MPPLWNFANNCLPRAWQVCGNHAGMFMLWLMTQVRCGHTGAGFRNLVRAVLWLPWDTCPNSWLMGSWLHRGCEVRTKRQGMNQKVSKTEMRAETSEREKKQSKEQTEVGVRKSRVFFEGQLILVLFFPPQQINKVHKCDSILLPSHLRAFFWPLKSQVLLSIALYVISLTPLLCLPLCAWDARAADERGFIKIQHLLLFKELTLQSEQPLFKCGKMSLAMQPLFLKLRLCTWCPPEHSYYLIIEHLQRHAHVGKTRKNETTPVQRGENSLDQTVLSPKFCINTVLKWKLPSIGKSL